jgi:nitrogen fixation protein FixH
MSDLQVGNVGSILRFTVVDQDGTVVDVSTATLVLYLRNPQERLLTKTPTLTSSGTDGRIQYALITGDLDIPGQWTAQARATISSNVFYSNVVTVPVQGNINA